MNRLRQRGKDRGVKHNIFQEFETSDTFWHTTARFSPHYPHDRAAWRKKTERDRGKERERRVKQINMRKEKDC